MLAATAAGAGAIVGLAACEDAEQKAVEHVEAKDDQGANQVDVGEAVAQDKEEDTEEEEEEAPAPPKWEFVEVKNDYAGVFLNEASKAKLRERFPPKFANEGYDHMTVIFEPTKEDVLDQDDLLTDNYTLHVIAHAEDEHAQAVLVELEHPHVKSRNKYAHVTLSWDGSPRYEAKYSNILFSRFADRKGARAVFRLSTDAKRPTSWEGELPVAGPFAASQGRLVNVEEEAITLEGTYCLASQWDGAACSYVHENGCSFCKFMKGGPCRAEFSAWEKCVSASREEDGKDSDNFIDRCGSLTLALKTCVDANTDYYYALTGDEETGAADSVEVDRASVEAESAGEAGAEPQSPTKDSI